jgi:hypothetical protein
MNLKRVDHKYFEWLISQIAIPNPREFDELFEMMHNYEFVWVVPNDDNRVQDARELRREFLRTVIHEVREPLAITVLFKNGVTVLEVLVSLSRQVAWLAGGDAPHWAWTLLENLKLERSYDPLSKGKRARIVCILENLVWRLYERDGQGGFFPLNNPKEDQTKVEIWYQMNAFVNEIDEQ